MGMFDKDDDWSPDIVCCKNCEHWEEGAAFGTCHDPNYNDSRATLPAFYCGHGERKMRGWKCLICVHSYRNAATKDLICSMTGLIVSRKSGWCSDFERKEECRYGTP